MIKFLSVIVFVSVVLTSSVSWSFWPGEATIVVYYEQYFSHLNVVNAAWLYEPILNNTTGAFSNKPNHLNEAAGDLFKIAQASYYCENDIWKVVTSTQLAYQALGSGGGVGNKMSSLAAMNTVPVGPCNPCKAQLAAKIAECGPGNINMPDWDQETCTGECICPAEKDKETWQLQFGDFSSLVGTTMCLGGCQMQIVYSQLEGPPVTLPGSTEPDYLSQIKTRYLGLPCSGQPILPPELPPPEDCGPKIANCQMSCGGPENVLKNECFIDGETGSAVAQCECKPLPDCNAVQDACAESCGGNDNVETNTCSMVNDAPVPGVCRCLSPPVEPPEKNCNDYDAMCKNSCGEGNVKFFECRDYSYGPQVTTPCVCGRPIEKCPAGAVCANDGVCQPGESKVSPDCAGDDDKDGCPNGQVCEHDDKCQAGESPDSYDCGGNNDGNENNDSGGGGEEDNSGGGTGGSPDGTPCPSGQICADDGVCQVGEAVTAADCNGKGSTEEGEAGQEGTGTGLCPVGSVCHGDGACQPGEPMTAVDCAGLNYTTTRFNQMADVIKSSAMLTPLSTFKVPAGGSSVLSVDLGRVGGVREFDFSKFASVWLILNALFTLTGCWVGIRIITLKR